MDLGLYFSMSKGVSRVNTFVSKKISCVRWRPVPQHVLTQSDQFVSGSWDDEENCVQLWRWDGEGDEPCCLHQLPVKRDITCLAYISTDLFALATAGGDVTLYRHTGDRLQPSRHWEKLHSSGGDALPCTWVSAFEEELVTVGDDGRICVLDIASQKPTRVIDDADTCSLYRVQHISHGSVVTSSMRGQIRCWDLRAAQPSPTASVAASHQQCGVASLARHPTQYHVLASGDTDGVICIWDLRQPRYAVTELKSHSAEVSDLVFHRSSPDSLFSSSLDGTVCQWNVAAGRLHGNSSFRANSSLRIDTSINANVKAKDTSLSGGLASSWLTLDSTRRYLDVLSLLPAGPLPVNSLDVAEDRLVCAGDNHVVHCVSYLAV